MAKAFNTLTPIKKSSSGCCHAVPLFDIGYKLKVYDWNYNLEDISLPDPGQALYNTHFIQYLVSSHPAPAIDIENLLSNYP